MPDSILSDASMHFIDQEPDGHTDCRSDIIPEYSPEHLIALSEPTSSQFGFIKILA